MSVNISKNVVELTGIYGGDETHALSAWTSTSRELTEEKVGRIPGLLQMLAENDHGTPFEKSSIQFLITTDIATHIQLLKHRIGVSINAESARYKELNDDKVYVPVEWSQELQDEYIAHMELTYERYHECLKKLIAAGVPRKRAKESARFYLPYGNQITADIMFNFRSFYHFLTTRYSYHAQKEIREVAGGMLTAVHKTGQFNKTLVAFGLILEDGSLRGPFD